MARLVVTTARTRKRTYINFAGMQIFLLVFQAFSRSRGFPCAIEHPIAHALG